MSEADEVLLRKHVSEMFKLPIRTVDYLVATNQIPFSRLGKRSVRFSKKRLEKPVIKIGLLRMKPGWQSLFRNRWSEFLGKRVI